MDGGLRYPFGGRTSNLPAFAARHYHAAVGGFREAPLCQQPAQKKI